jgi:hypothetical protein
MILHYHRPKAIKQTPLSLLSDFEAAVYLTIHANQIRLNHQLN